MAERIDAAIITTFKGKGVVDDAHPLACGVLGRSGTPVGSTMMARSDLLVVLGASFSEHTGIADYKPIIQVDFDRMLLGKTHAVAVPLWGDIGTTVAALCDQLEPRERPQVHEDIEKRWDYWRAEKQRKLTEHDSGRGIHPAKVFGELSQLVPDDAVLCVDVGNNTYSFGRFFECKRQSVLMSGYLGSIGFAFPAAMGAWAAVGDRRKVVSISGDGGFGQYLADFTTAVKYGMSICHVLLNNGELAKISKEQRSAAYPVWQTELHNPDFAAFARLCGGVGIRATEPDQLQAALREALVADRPALVEIVTDPRET
jgi:thiamine pyrophosphate-dependent acetolactate synthase large subunit-like protein